MTPSTDIRTRVREVIEAGDQDYMLRFNTKWAATISPMLRDAIRIPDEGERWHDNSVQFPRLLAEIVANVNLTVAQHNELCASMDLESEELDELFERAQVAWEEIKEANR